MVYFVNRAIAVAGIAVIVVLFATLNLHNQKSLDSVFALSGYSPIDWTNQVIDPTWTKNNFPSGVENYSESLFMHIYPVATKVFKITPETTARVILFLEPLFVIAIAFFISKGISRKFTIPLFILVAALFFASFARTPNLGNFSNPFYLGLYYNLVDLLRLGAIVANLKGKYTLSGILLGLSFTTHPTLSLMAAGFIAATMIPNIKDVIKKKSFVLGLGCFLLISLSWFIFNFKTSQLGASSIPTDLWFQLTRAFSYHWYPLDLGFFTFESGSHVIPIASFLLVLIFFLEKRHPINLIEKKLIFGFIGVAIMATIGIINSYFKVSPTLTKLALQRSTDLLILFGLPIIVEGFLQDLRSGSLYQKFWSAIFIFSSFISPFPALYSLGLVLPTVISKLRHKVISITAIFSLLFLITLGILKFCRFIVLSNSDYIGISRSEWRLVAICLTVLIVVSILKKFVSISPSLVITPVLVTFFCSQWISNQPPNQEYVKLGNAYKEVQIWAKNNTKVTTVFMPDPTIYYGWRDFSQRSSFGNLREWLHTSWLYNSDIIAFNEGMARVRDFGIEPTKYLNEHRALEGSEKMTDDLRNNFYILSDNDLLKITKKHSVEYVVKEIRYVKQPSLLPLAYQNHYFSVYKT